MALVLLREIAWCIFIIDSIVVSSDYCIWGRAAEDYSNGIVNGQYVENSVYTNGKPSYTKTSNDPCDPTIIYLFWSDVFSDWSIANELNSVDVYAFCIESDLSDCTAGEWTMTVGGTWFTEPNMYAQSGSCPQVCLIHIFEIIIDTLNTQKTTSGTVHL